MDLSNFLELPMNIEMTCLEFQLFTDNRNGRRIPSKPDIYIGFRGLRVY